MRLAEILRGLHDAHVECVVVGGLAANVHGSPRITADVDVCYDPSPENRERLARLLREWNAYLRGVEPGLPFTMDERTLRDCPVMTLVTDLGDFDVMDRVAGVGEYPAVRAASVQADLAGVRANVLTLDALISAKRATGRRKDREALLELEALREERRRRGM
jgi:predicted nucleotidyltransferase